MGFITENRRTEKDIELLVNQVQGVIASRVVQQGEEIVEIHVLAGTNRGPKQLVRDIESAVLVKMGQQIDYKKISIAQLGEEQKQLLEIPRLKLLEINSTTSQDKLSVTATIGLENETFSASLSGPNIQKNRLALISKAVLEAVEKCHNISSKLEIDRIEKIPISCHMAILAVVSHCMESGEEILLGVSLIKGNDQVAAAKASLDAINRRLLIISGKNN